MSWKKIAAAGAFTVVVLGGGGTALALGTHSTAGTGSPSSSSSSSSSAGKADHKRKHHGDALTRALYATWTTKGKDGKSFVTHDEIRGTVTAASATSVTVKADNGKTETYKVTKDTKFRVRPTDTKGKATPSTSAAAKAGLHAVVLGTGTTDLTATSVVIGGK